MVRRSRVHKLHFEFGIIVKLVIHQFPVFFSLSQYDCYLEISRYKRFAPLKLANSITFIEPNADYVRRLFVKRKDTAIFIRFHFLGFTCRTIYASLFWQFIKLSTPFLCWIRLKHSHNGGINEANLYLWECVFWSTWAISSAAIETLFPFWLFQ